MAHLKKKKSTKTKRRGNASKAESEASRSTLSVSRFLLSRHVISLLRLQFPQVVSKAWGFVSVSNKM